MPTSRLLSHAEARAFYDRFGAKQDAQQFYERPAVDDLVAHLDLGRARAVVEFGCGTGRLAAELLETKLDPGARYLGLDISTTMVELARSRVSPYGARAAIRQTDGAPRIDAPDATFDRFLSSYVFDLLSAEDIRAVLAEAHRVLEPGGLLGVVSLTRGCGGAARVVTLLWERIHRLRPTLVGGCRPIAILDHVSPPSWRLRHHNVVAPFALASEIVVAERT